VKPRPDRGDDGTTLAELVVSMLVFGLFGTVLATTVVQTTRLARTSAVRETTAQQASLLVAQVTKDLRSAVPVGADARTQSAFTFATSTEVAFFSSATPDVLHERLRVESGRLVRETQRPDDRTVFPDLRYTDPLRTRVQQLLPPGVAHTVTFGYVLETDPTTVRPSVTGIDGLQSVAAITVTVTVDGDGPGGLPPVVLESTVHPYNGAGAT
jgi:type II secretory pathway pseudopilin PulG